MMTRVMITPAPAEPAVTHWQERPFDAVVAELLDRLGPGRRVVAVDGRGGGGKTTLARRLAERVPAAAVVGTDDIAWYESMFDWTDLLIGGVLRPYRAGSAVAYRPPAWDRRDRLGAIEVAASVRVLIIEGVGASRVELSPWLDGTVWVQSDFAEAERRGIARDIASGVNGDAEASIAFWHAWMAEELPFFARDRPWERADLIVAGTSSSSLPDGAVAVSPWHDGAP
jgi:hypothetical protein